MKYQQLDPPHPPQFLRKRKFLMVLPVLVIPFVFAAFASLGGGKGVPGTRQDSAAGKGFNKTLPIPHFSKFDSLLDKLGLYKRADEDSVKMAEKIKQDPYHATPPPPTDARADQMLQKLAVLKHTLTQPVIAPSAPASPPMPPAPIIPPTSLVAPPDLPVTPPDPQMERLNGMLDKIMRIQRPPKDPPNEKDSTAAPRLILLPPDEDTLVDGFYPVGDEPSADSQTQNTIPAVVEDNETLVSGSTVTLRITTASRINGVDIPRNNLVYGLATINGDRMRIAISSIRCGESIYPVALQVYGLDGLPGIHIPGLIARDVAKQSAGDGVGSMDLGSFDPSLGAQVANAGIQAGKTLLSKKIKLVQVSVRAGYQVLLKNTDTLHQR